MAFMEIETQFGPYYLVETTHGTSLVPGELATVDPNEPEQYARLQDYVEGTVDEDSTVTLKQGWYGRYSAPGYMDCTDWTWADTEEELIAELKSMHGDEDEDDND